MLLSLTDELGQEHEVGNPPRRIVSLVPSITETLFELGLGSSIVGVTDFCIFPAEIPAGIARVGGTKTPAVGRIRSLDPDLIHMNLEENLARHANELRSFCRLFVTEPKSVQDVAALIADLGELHDCRVAASRILEDLRIEVAKAFTGAEFSFACPIWKDPWMWCGGDTYVSNLVASAGGRNVLAGWRRYPQLALGEVIERSPQLIFLPDEPYEFSEADRCELEASAPGAAIIGPFPGHLFTWHGSRTLAGLRWLRETLESSVQLRNS